MTALRNIFSVAHYERIMLMRTVRFRFLGFAGIAMPMFFGVVLAIAETFGEIDESASVFGLSAFVPFYFYTYTQTALIAFVAGNFRAADDNAEVGEVIAARPMSTAQMVIGKYVGVLQALAALAALVAGLTISIQAAKLSIMGAPLTLAPYGYYFFLMMLPALLFASALTFCLGAILRHPTVVALLSVAYGLSVLFYLGHHYDGLFDFGAFFAPLFYSDMLGVGDISRLMQIRLMYVAISFALLGLAVVAYPRLPNPGMGKWAGHAMVAVGIVGALGAYSIISTGDAAAIERRAGLLATQVAHATEPAATVRHYDIDLSLMTGVAPLSADVGLLVSNDGADPLERLVFTLNPGLEMTGVHDAGGRAMPFEVDGSVIRVALAQPLLAGQELELGMTYAGTIDRDGFDLMRGRARLEKWDGPIHKGDLTAWIQDGSAYLPPRSRWYPVPGVDYGHQSQRPVSFSTARLEIDVPEGLTVITQGAPVPENGAGRDASAGRSRHVWEVARPVPVLSLNVDRYEVLSAEIADTLVSFYVYPLHRPQVEFFADAVEEVTDLVEQLLTTMESESGLPYPYPRLSIVEIPFLVQWYYEGWEESGGLTQPGVLMIEEDALIERLTRLRASFERSMRSDRNGNRDPARVKRDQLASAIFTAFLSNDRGRSSTGGLFRSPLVQLWSFNRDFTGANADLMARGLPVYMQEDVTANMRALMFDRRRGGRDIPARAADDAGAISRDGSLGNSGVVAWDAQLAAMQSKPLAGFDVAAEPDLYRAVLDTKGLTMFRVIEAIVGSGAFTNAIEGFGAATAYEEVSFADFERAVLPAATEAAEATEATEAKEATEATEATEPGGADLGALIRDWIHGTQVPGFNITYTDTMKRANDWGTVQYQVVVRLRNGEPGRGFAQVRVVGEDDTVSRNVQIDGGQQVEVSLVSNTRPRRIAIEPFLAKNRRQIGAPLRVPDKITPGVAASYVRLVPEEANRRTEIVVDNEDEGFSMPVRRVRRYLRPGLQGGNWRVRSNSYAFGLYETNYRTRPPGDGAQPAIWTTGLPFDGEYDVAYYYLPERVNGRSIRWRAADDFYLTVFHAGGETRVVLDGDRLLPGWNAIGRFRFRSGDAAVIELSDDADGWVYADAMRWRYFDPAADTRYYDAVAPWETSGRSSGSRDQ